VKRREFITLLGGAAAAWPRAARAQQAMPLVGLLSAIDLDDRQLAALRQGLDEAGYVAGKNVAMEYRSAAGQYNQLRALAEGLVHRQPKVIVVTGSLGAVLAVKAATATIPIVFAVGVDPVKYGLVASFNRPGGNLTGVNFRSLELATKRIEFLSELVPQATTIAFLAGGSRFLTFEEQTDDVHTAARALGRQITVLECRSEQDIDAAFTRIVDQSPGALVVGAFPLFFDRRNHSKILQLAARHKIPAIYPIRTYVIAGGLMSYSTDISLYRQLGVNYVGRILKGGRKPADLAVEQASKFALSINLKTAKALGLDVPPILLAIADEVIE
jgi:ABC-type uncharacterized transport system substrate-binding protein